MCKKSLAKMLYNTFFISGVLTKSIDVQKMKMLAGPNSVPFAVLNVNVAF